VEESDFMIGIFDSGIGGVTVLKEILNILPHYHYIYYSDAINNPYGDKTKEELYIITKNIVEELVNKGCKIIVIACNTASSICKDMLRDNFDIPIIAIEPAIKQVYNANTQGKTLVMATKGTIESENFLKLYHRFDNHNLIIEACSGLADLIEQGNTLKAKKYLKEHLNYKDIENVVLGCTHYPLIEKEIKEVLGNVKIYHGGVGVAKRLKTVVEDINLEKSELKIEFIDSSHDINKKERFYKILEEL